MKSDLDEIMQAQDIDALLVTGAGIHNPAMVYFIGTGVHISAADVIKKRGEPAILFHGPMERDEAAKTGLVTRSYANYSAKELFKQAGGDQARVEALMYKSMLQDAGVSKGRVALYGQIEFGKGIALCETIEALVPQISFVRMMRDDLLARAMSTKDVKEIEQIREIGRITTRVVARVADYLTGQKVHDEMLVDKKGDPIQVKDIKKKINVWLAEEGAENPEGTIFAIGKDGGIPHSAGNGADILRVGVPIVFDIFPCQAGGGYFYDFTRTWCLSYAPEVVHKLYGQVRSVYETIIAELEANQLFVKYQRRACELFEAMGHVTVMTNPETEEGYVHSLGHGVGLHVQEIPFSRLYGPMDGRLISGTVFTIEPGLYYPSKEVGVRLEDTYWVTPEGKIEKLVDYPMDLVLPITV
jgi:Xaa-Pro aminopeptidase